MYGYEVKNERRRQKVLSALEKSAADVFRENTRDGNPNTVALIEVQFGKVRFRAQYCLRHEILFKSDRLRVLTRAGESVVASEQTPIDLVP